MLKNKMVYYHCVKLKYSDCEMDNNMGSYDLH